MTSSATCAPQAACLARVLDLRVAPGGDALDRFEAAWNRAAEGRKPLRVRVLSFGTLPLLLKTLSPARWTLLQRLSTDGPLSIYELSKRLNRDYKNVYTDAKQLEDLGLISRDDNSRVAVPWDAVRAELRL
jgi:predicted transcriptional regulator